MAFNLSAFAGAGAQFFDSNGVPLAGGLLYVYTAGTTTPATTWTTSSGAVANTNPIVMNAAGRTPYEIWLNSGVTYKFALYTSTNVLIGTYDNIPAIDDPTVFNNLITVTGTNTLIGTSVPPYTSYVAGMTLSFIPVATNTGAVTIDVDGLGAKNIFVGSATALSSGDLVAGRIANLEYDGTRFQLYQSSLADGAVTYAKIQTVAAGKVLGRNTSGAGVVQELPIAVDSSGNVGIGTNPNSKLDVDGQGLFRGLSNKNSSTAGTGFTYFDMGVDSDGAIRTALLTSFSGTSSTLEFNTSVSGTRAERMRIKADGQLATTVTNGSAVMDIYGCRAWVNFNGTGTVAIRASGNVSSITDNGTGDYTVNFATAMPDANYGTSIAAEAVSGLNRYGYTSDFSAPTTTAYRLTIIQGGGGPADSARIGVAIFR